MVLLQPKLGLRVSQRQVLTPGLMQMVAVLALNKLELKEMINAEMVENPVLEEIDESVPLLDEVAGREAMLERPAEESSAPEAASGDSFEEIDLGSYFQEYLDPGFRTQQEYEETDRPSFENFLSQPTTLTDHLLWQLGSITLDPDLRLGCEFVIGNLDENGYLSASRQELDEAFTSELSQTGLSSRRPAVEVLAAAVETIRQLDPAGITASDLRECLLIQISLQRREYELIYTRTQSRNHPEPIDTESEDVVLEDLNFATKSEEDAEPSPSEIAVKHVAEEVESVHAERRQLFTTAERIVDRYLQLLQKRDLRDISRTIGRPQPEVQAAVDYIKTLDPRPGLRYNREQTRLIEPDVAFVKSSDGWAVVMNEEDMPSLRLSHQYRRMLTQADTGKEVKDYVKERFRSAMQLMRNIAQRKSTILRTCEVIVRRQQEFLEEGVEALRPMMIKEVAEEIGVHPSTVSRAVANKYAHTPQGVLELRFFFSEGANGPEGADTPLVVLKRKVRKLIEDENPSRPLTDDQLAALLQQQGIQVTRRTVAKYREDMHIPSTHQRRRREA